MTRRPPAPPIDSALVLPIGLLGMLIVGTVVVATDGRPGGTALLAVSCALVAAAAWVAEPIAAIPLAGLGWCTVAGFSRKPFGDLHLHATAVPALVLLLVAGAATGAATLRRLRYAVRTRYTRLPLDSEDTLDAVTTEAGPHPAARGLSGRRQLAGLVMAAVLLPVLTFALTAMRARLPFVDDVLLYLLAVIVVTVLGGFWPALLAAISSGLLINWYFTPPLHTWTIDAPANLLALLLFVSSAVTVSSVVHFAARRDAVARERSAEAATLLDLARTVLGGDDSPQAILDHLAATLGVSAELQERSGAQWIRIAGNPGSSGAGPATVVPAGPDLRLVVHGDLSGVSSRVLDGFAAQAAAASERQRLRIQAGQAEALAEGNRMRTALLAAVSHDLRSPLASVKAAVGSLRQTDVAWSEQDRSLLLATIEEGADRLDSLIGNLLDMSRVQTGALQPFVRPVALDEVAPLVVRGLDGADRLRFTIPDALPLIATDPGLLERALANLVANALRHSPPDRPPTITACAVDPGTVSVQVIDHGPGIAPPDRERVFEPFQQLGDRRTGGGVGLGLAVAKGFVESLGGRISARSTPGGGLTMCVDLPVAGAVHPAGSGA